MIVPCCWVQKATVARLRDSALPARLSSSSLYMGSEIFLAKAVFDTSCTDTTGNRFYVPDPTVTKSYL